ncbi:Putative lumenal protein, contains 8 pentapeptide repeats, sll0301 homolog [uncultured Synechococcales cyanobacterium]|uniref:Lumenal protein, contains 8 pentapeptide repeats, sll0301 homolog n=1 Tax=uncultured Synechococcales cyanobacterium TaxID=1936017 RepID=A0A6J4VKZ1_9CYAN|nr:Putative lumenal protein, contains 8 pentapeptide repeats, sll0301 homolog [uncultured Synechococcales cyanobacterium]
MRVDKFFLFQVLGWILILCLAWLWVLLSALPAIAAGSIIQGLC